MREYYFMRGATKAVEAENSNRILGVDVRFRRTASRGSVDVPVRVSSG